MKTPTRTEPNGSSTQSGEVFSEFISERSTFTAKVYEEALVPDSPVSPSPLRNGLLTLVMGWGLIGLLVLIHPSA